MVGMILKAGLFIGVCNGVRLDNWTFIILEIVD